MAGSCYRCVGASLAALVGLTLLLFTGSIASSDDLRIRVQQDCQACDTNFMAAINTYQSDFGKWNTAVDGAKYHCGRFAKIRTCYTDCLHDSMYTYSSSMKAIYEPFYSGICDPVCYVAVLPYCYTSTVGSYDITKSCDGANMNQNLKRCVLTELFSKQNCTGVCTRGQRKALFYFFSTMFQCTIPYQTANDCFTWSLYCSEAIFGYNGANYVDYANHTMMASNRLGCSAYGDAYRDCVQQAIDGEVVLGNEPYSVTYDSPCADLTDELKFLTDFDYSMLVASFCDNPTQSFNDTCQAYAAPTTTTRTTTTTTTTQRPSTTAATTRAGPLAASTIVAEAPAAATALPTASVPAPAAGNAGSAGLPATAGSADSQQPAALPSSSTTTTASASAPPPIAGGPASGAGGQPAGVTTELSNAAGGAATAVSPPAASKLASTKRSVSTTKLPHRLITTTPTDAAVAVASRAAVVLLACAAAGLGVHLGFN